MSQASSTPTNATATKTPARRARKRLRFIAAVRFTDGHCERFSVDNARDHEDARRMVFDELSDVAAVVVAGDR